MKTNKQNSKSGLESRSEQLSTPKTTAAAETPTNRKTDERLPIDYAKRQANRQLPTEKLLEQLRTSAPDFFALAEVVGKWVWIQFTGKQPREITARLAEFGFHWNNKRQAWQHPCGAFRQRPFNGDPRERYGSQFPHETQAA
jgi:hypothetical protein